MKCNRRKSTKDNNQYSKLKINIDPLQNSANHARINCQSLQPITCKQELAPGWSRTPIKIKQIFSFIKRATGTTLRPIDKQQNDRPKYTFCKAFCHHFLEL